LPHAHLVGVIGVVEQDVDQGSRSNVVQEVVAGQIDQDSSGLGSTRHQCVLRHTVGQSSGHGEGGVGGGLLVNDCVPSLAVRRINTAFFNATGAISLARLSSSTGTTELGIQWNETHASREVIFGVRPARVDNERWLQGCHVGWQSHGVDLVSVGGVQPVN